MKAKAKPINHKAKITITTQAGKPLLVESELMATEVTVIPFDAGVCSISPVKDEPGRYWCEVRFTARDGAGMQFEVWNDELATLEKDISNNFIGSDVVGLPLAPLPA